MVQKQKENQQIAFDAVNGLDEVDWRILGELQANARQTFAELGRQVGLTAPAVAERVRRLEDTGIITGYHAEINTERLGLHLTAYMRYSTPTMSYAKIEPIIKSYPEILECHRVTGDDCFVMRIAVASIAHLESLINRLTPYGTMTTSLVLSSVFTRRDLTPENLEWEPVVRG
jgi:Lrp/AsnC family leucine-responsive transcriptional regulator